MDCICFSKTGCEQALPGLTPASTIVTTAKTAAGPSLKLTFFIITLSEQSKWRARQCGALDTGISEPPPPSQATRVMRGRDQAPNLFIGNMLRVRARGARSPPPKLQVNTLLGLISDDKYGIMAPLVS